MQVVIPVLHLTASASLAGAPLDPPAIFDRPFLIAGPFNDHPAYMVDAVLHLDYRKGLALLGAGASALMYRVVSQAVYLYVYLYIYVYLSTGIYLCIYRICIYTRALLAWLRRLWLSCRSVHERERTVAGTLCAAWGPTTFCSTVWG